MSHGLVGTNTATGQATMAYAREFGVPWHGMGVSCDGLMTLTDVLNQSGTDFQVAKKKIWRVNPGTREIERLDGKFEILRTDTWDSLGVVGNYYEPLQNSEAFSFIDQIIGEGNASYDTAGSLWGGKKIWLLAKLTQDMIVGRNDVVERYLLFMNSHDGSTPITVKFTDVRVVCWNTLSASLRSGRRAGENGEAVCVKIRHTKNAMERLAEAARVLGLSMKHFDQKQRIYGEMAGFQMNKVRLETFYKMVLPDKPGRSNTQRQKQRQSWVEIFESSPAITEVPEARGSIWGAYNAITEALQYDSRIKDGNGFATIVADPASQIQDKRDTAFQAAIQFMSEN